MERRKVLAAITAAIATPATAWAEAHQAEQIAAGEDPNRVASSKVPYHPNLGLTALQADVRKALNERLLGQLNLLLECSAGPQGLLDTWLLSEALMEWQSGEYSYEFCGLANALLFVLQRDSRFVVVPESMHSNVEEFIDVSKDVKERVVGVPHQIEEQVLDVIRCLMRHGSEELHIVIESGPHAVRPRRRNQTVMITGVEPWKDAPAEA